jgi:hypothetical protein
MKWPVGTELWLVQIRYWEEADNPIRVTVSQLPTETGYRHLMVQHPEYGHEAYVPAERCFYSRDSAVRAAQLLTQLKDLKLDDEVDFLMREETDREYSANPEMLQYADRALELAPVCRVVNVYSGYIVEPIHRPHVYAHGHESMVYWDSYSADKVAKKLDGEHGSKYFKRISIKVQELESDDEG